MKIALVTVGYNRPDSMKRLLYSICKAQYNHPCDLIISLDYSTEQNKLIEIAEKTNWNNGEKIIRAFKENQGLRKHVLQCGDLTDKYDAVVVLEDDLVVAEGFFQYVVEAVERYKNDSVIAGISLYTHRTNPGNGRPFEAQYNGYDAFMMQYAQSWGQCWTRNMWKGFRLWYDKQNDLCDDGIIPSYVTNWNKQSWLKYYIRYTAENKLFHVYPYFSLTTNSTDVGEHNFESSSAYQVPVVYGIPRDYRFPSVTEAIKYDAYFERIFGDEMSKKAIIDLYGLKCSFDDADILYSTAILNYKVINRISLKYRPHEVNLMIQEPGCGIYVYDLHSIEKNKEKNMLSIASYDFKAESSRLTLLHGLHGLKNKVKQRMARKDR